MNKVERLETSCSIEALSEDEAPTQILEHPPEPGSIESRREYPVLGAVELTLSNGMRVCNLSKHIVVPILHVILPHYPYTVACHVHALSETLLPFPTLSFSPCATFSEYASRTP